MLKHCCAWLTAATLFTNSFGQVITVTEYASACSAIYTSGTTSVTVVQSTVTVSPVPFSDAAANSGTPFVLQLPSNYGPDRKRQETEYLDANGYLTPNLNLAAEYVINDGKMKIAGGAYLSTSGGSMPFAVPATPGTIDTTIVAGNDKLSWTNPSFASGKAMFYVDANAHRVYIDFQNNPEYGWDPVALELIPTPYSGATSMPASYSMTSYVYSPTSATGGAANSPPAYTATGGGSPGSSPSPTAGANVSPDGTCGSDVGYNCAGSEFGDCCGMYDYCGSGSDYCGSGCQSLFGSCSGSPMSSVSPSSSSMAPAMPTNLSPDGTCGGDSGFNCQGSDFGDCCSDYGYCGTGTGYCDSNCQPAFGSCDPSVSESSMMSSVSSMSMPPVQGGSSMGIPFYSTPSSAATASTTQMTLSVSVGSVTQASSSTPMAAAPTFSCPQNDMSTVTDTTGSQYNLGCGMDTSNGAYGSAQAPNSFDDCFALCDAKSACTAFTYVGGNNGQGSGACFFKNVASSLFAGSSGMVGAIRVSSGTVPQSSSSITTLSTFSSADQPIGPNNPASTVPTTMSGDNGSTPPSYTGAAPTSSGPGVSSDANSGAAPSTETTGPTTSSSSDSSTATGPPVSPNGHCGTAGNGGTVEGYTCSGSEFGTCCSASGFCGSTSDYCVAGCQSAYGACTPQTGNPITSMGECGINNGNQTCTGGIFGDCCSGSGFCGTGSDYCSAGCDPNFGTCDAVSSSTEVMPSTTSSTPSSTSMSVPTSTPSYVCPAIDGQTVTDQYGTQYIIGCGTDTTSGTYAQEAAANSWDDCFAQCATSPTNQGAGRCSAFTYLGQANGVGPGTCFLKSAASESFQSSGGSVYLVGAIVLQYYVPTSPSSSLASSTAMMSSSMSSSAMQQVTTTTTTTSSAQRTTTTTTTSHPVTATTTTSTPATNSATSSSAYLVLISPTACSYGDPAGTDEDDSYCEIDLPFSMRMYGQLDTHSFASTNGILSIQYGSSQYQADTLPDVNIPNNTVCPFFDDLYLYGVSSPQQGIFYQFNSANTAVTYEYYLARAGTAGQIYHFTVFYDSGQPGIFTFTYYSVGNNDNGEYASVGIQGFPATGAQEGYQYSIQSADITPGLQVICNTLLNTCSPLNP